MRPHDVGRCSSRSAVTFPGFRQSRVRVGSIWERPADSDDGPWKVFRATGPVGDLSAADVCVREVNGWNALAKRGDQGFRGLYFQCFPTPWTRVGRRGSEMSELGWLSLRMQQLGSSAAQLSAHALDLSNSAKQTRATFSRQRGSLARASQRWRANWSVRAIRWGSLQTQHPDINGRSCDGR